MDAILVQPDSQVRRRSSVSEKPFSGSGVTEREKEKNRERAGRGILNRVGLTSGRSTGVGLSITAGGTRRSYALAPCHHLFVSFLVYPSIVKY